MENELRDLPENVRRILTEFVDSAKGALGERLASAVLFGSAAEGRLRPTSDVNLILVLKSFDVSRIDTLREKLRMAHAAIQLNVMFVLDTEIAAASEAFAVKFTDIFSRHRVLAGNDPFKHLDIPKSAVIQRLNQVLVNLTLRLRERYALVSLREEQLVPIIADVAGPIRACAATILGLEGKTVEHPKEALQILTQGLGGRSWNGILANMSTAREEQELKPGQASETLLGILDLLEAIRNRVRTLV